VGHVSNVPGKIGTLETCPTFLPDAVTMFLPGAGHSFSQQKTFPQTAIAAGFPIFFDCTPA
jgi:hypothetical protein